MCKSSAELTDENKVSQKNTIHPNTPEMVRKQELSPCYQKKLKKFIYCAL
jgi:hypothetical protein